MYDKKSKLLTCASADVSMLRKIKEVFREKVYIIYCYVDAAALEGLYVNLPGMNADEYGSRMAMGLSIKECYSKNVDLFDSVIIYGGEGSVFNYKTIYQQLDAILGEEKRENNNEIKIDNRSYDIYVSASKKDLVHSQSNQHAEFIEDMVASLVCCGIRVFNSWDDLSSGGDFYKSIKNAINGSRVFLPIISENSFEDIFFMKN